MAHDELLTSLSSHLIIIILKDFFLNPLEFKTEFYFKATQSECILLFEWAPPLFQTLGEMGSSRDS